MFSALGYGLNMADASEILQIPDRDDVLGTMEYSMKFNRGKASNAARDVAAAALARMVLEHLELSGFVIMKKPPGRAHSVPSNPQRLTD